MAGVDLGAGSLVGAGGGDVTGLVAQVRSSVRSAPSVGFQGLEPVSSFAPMIRMRSGWGRPGRPAPARPATGHRRIGRPWRTTGTTAGRWEPLTRLPWARASTPRRGRGRRRVAPAGDGVALGGATGRACWCWRPSRRDRHPGCGRGRRRAYGCHHGRGARLRLGRRRATTRPPPLPGAEHGPYASTSGGSAWRSERPNARISRETEVVAVARRARLDEVARRRPHRAPAPRHRTDGRGAGDARARRGLAWASAARMPKTRTATSSRTGKGPRGDRAERMVLVCRRAALRPEAAVRAARRTFGNRCVNARVLAQPVGRVMIRTRPPAGGSGEGSIA